MIAIEKNETNRYTNPVIGVHQPGTNNIPGGNHSVLPSSVAGSSNSDGLHDRLSRVRCWNKVNCNFQKLIPHFEMIDFK